MPIDPGMPYIQLLFDVTLRGEVREIRLESSNLSDPDPLFREIKREMASARYRPAIQNGKMSKSTGASRVVTSPKLNVELVSTPGFNYAGGVNVPGNSLEWK